MAQDLGAKAKELTVTKPAGWVRNAHPAVRVVLAVVGIGIAVAGVTMAWTAIMSFMGGKK